MENNHTQNQTTKDFNWFEKLEELDCTIEELPKQERKIKIKEEKEKYWNEVGWHRPLAGFWYNFVFILLLLVPALVSLALLEIVMPYSEGLGFADYTMTLLLPLYNLADFGIKEAINRYVSQYADTDTRKAVSYLSFFVWFQMFSGLIQITIVSIIAVTVIPYTTWSYAVWFFLTFIMIQWPGTAGLFSTALGGFQQFDKQNILTIMQDVALQIFTQIGLIILGRYLGGLNPVVGELMGAVMGFIVGSYIDDLLTMVLGYYFFKRTLEPYGIDIKEVFRISYDREIVKEILLYGGKVMPSGLSFYFVSATITLMKGEWLANFPTWIGLYSVASLLVGALSVSFSMSEAMSEAYNNGKKKITLYIIRSQFMWWGIISIGILTAPLLFLIPPLAGNILNEYRDVQWMIFPLSIGGFVLFPSIFSGYICQACDLPEHATIMNFIEQGTRFFTYLYALAPWGIRLLVFNITGSASAANMALLYMWLFAEAPGYITKAIYAWWIIKKKLFPGERINIPWFQTLVVPLIAVFLFIPLYQVMITIFIIVFTLSDILGYILAVLYLLSVLFIFPIYLFMPLYGFFGTWDEKSLDSFRKAAIMSGPSRFLVNRLYKGAKFGYKRSPFKKTWRKDIYFGKRKIILQNIIEFEDAYKEIEELEVIRSINRERLKKTNNK